VTDKPTAEVYNIRDYQLKRMERHAAEILNRALNPDGGKDAVSQTDPWAGKHVPDGIDGL